MNPTSLALAWIIPLLALMVSGCGDSSTPAKSGHGGADSTHAKGDGMAGMAGMADGAMQPQGVSASNEHFTLQLLTKRVAASDATLRFRIVSRHGGILRDYEPEYTKQLHLILVRHDLTGYQHLHPTLGSDGTWQVDANFATPGPHRLIADFTPTGGEKTALATDVAVGDGSTYRPEPLHAPDRAETIDGYEVKLDVEHMRPGVEGALALDVRRDGRPVALQPYLGALGHAVVLRTTDFAYLHVHPSERAAADRQLTFDVTLPTAGRFVAYVQFRADDEVHTAIFTLDARDGDAS